MRNTIIRILTSAAMIAIAAGAVVAEYYGIHAVRYLAVAIVVGMIVEFFYAWRKKIQQSREQRAESRYKKVKKYIYALLAMLYALLMLASAWFVGGRPWIVLLLLLIIVSADIGAWLFGRLIGGDKMWPAVSPGKTWAGQIAGIVCGTVASLMYGFIGTSIAIGHLAYGKFMPQLMWIGISVALLSQYGDLTASWVKRKLGIKDYSHILPGHGGVIDRFDGWIYVLPIIWLVML
ncbi:MAG: phosphatidate cytidylyltransferase [Proteobacteria bacterium]|nr:phosphatidate cytidylyltransferase [Pseudomonadota bacterium]